MGSPVFVTESADLTIAAKRVGWGAFMNCGQTCIRPDYVLVHSSVADRFMAELEKTVGSMYGQDPKKSDYFGRVINVRAHERLMSIIEDARTKGKCVVRFGGASAAEDRYIAPT